MTNNNAVNNYAVVHCVGSPIEYLSPLTWCFTRSWIFSQGDLLLNLLVFSKFHHLQKEFIDEFCLWAILIESPGCPVTRQGHQGELGLETSKGYQVVILQDCIGHYGILLWSPGCSFMKKIVPRALGWFGIIKLRSYRSLQDPTPVSYKMKVPCPVKVN